MTTFELIPNDHHKSFYGKAVVEQDSKGVQTLYSYNTPIIRKAPDGSLERLWGGYSKTTQRHIVAFCGLSKAQFEALPISES